MIVDYKREMFQWWFLLLMQALAIDMVILPVSCIVSRVRESLERC